MARIIYKEGCERQNRLESIEGIEIELLNGQKALIYPKYSEEVMLPMENIKYYGQEPDTEIVALKETESECLTDALHDCGSPAAEFVHKFRSDKHGRFYLPTLLAAMELQDQKSVIDEEGKFKADNPINERATRIAAKHHGIIPSDVIVGNAILCHTSMVE